MHRAQAILPTRGEDFFQGAAQVVFVMPAGIVRLEFGDVADPPDVVAAAVGGLVGPGEFFSGDAIPASTWVGVAALADPGFLIEIEAVAVLD